MALTCGDNGSSGSQVIGQVNANETNIVANAAAIVVNTGKIAVLENLQGYVANSNSDVLDVPETYTEVAAISATMSSGKYILTMSTTYTFDATNQSVFIRLTVNGDSSREYLIEPKDNTDNQPVTYTFPLDLTAASLTMSLEMRKESAANTLNIKVANLIADKRAEL